MKDTGRSTGQQRSTCGPAAAAADSVDVSGQHGPVLRLSGLALLLALVLGWLFAAQRSEPAVVDSVRVIERDLSARLNLTGEVINDRTVSMTALLDGEITDIRARTGQEVAAGMVLATLDERLAAGRREQAAAVVAKARHRLTAVIRSHRRLTLLSQRRDVSEQTLEDSLLTLQDAVNDVVLAAADLDMAELQLQNATIRAPFDAIVIDQVAEKGQWVEAGTALFTLVARRGITIEALVDVADAARVQLGQRVWLESDAYPGELWQSAIGWRAPSVRREDAPTRDAFGGDRNAFAVRIPPGKEAPPLLLGQQLDVQVEFEHRTGVRSLPLTALERAPDGTWSVWVESQGKARRRAVETGLLTLRYAEITGGLAPQERVLLPQAPLAEGQSVRQRAP